MHHVARDCVVRTPVQYSRDQILAEKEYHEAFNDFAQFIWQMPRHCLKLCCDRFIPHQMQFIIY
jgi:hypothetical protein